MFANAARHGSQFGHFRHAGAVGLVAAVFLAVLIPGTAAAASFSARAAINPTIQFLGDSAGTTFTVTVRNTGTSSSIGAVRIDRPYAMWTITACPGGPAGWSATTSATSCDYLSATGTADDIPHGQTATFQVTATTAGAKENRFGRWPVIVSTTNDFNDPATLNRAKRLNPGVLKVGLFSFEILDAVIVSSPQAPGTACPSGAHDAAAGSGGHVLVICGRNRTTVPLVPKQSFSSLGGSFVASHGAFTSGTVSPTTTIVVLGSWSDVIVTSTAASTHAVVAQIGSRAARKSPVNTLSGYSATVVPPPPNSTPVANDDAYTTAEDAPLTIANPGVLSNDTDADGDALVVTNPGTTATTHGTVTRNADGSFAYTPSANYNGPDAFTYDISDSHGGTDTGTVNLTVTASNDPPVASGDSYSTAQDTSLGVVAPGVLGNDSDADGDSLAVTNAGTFLSTQAGSVTLNGDGSFDYAPLTAFNGADSFTYAISDGHGGTDSATVTITVGTQNTSNFTLTAGIDNFTGTAGTNNVFRFTSSTLQSTDTVTGGAAGAFIDLLSMTAPGTISGSQFAGVTNIERLVLPNGTNNVTLTNGLVGGTSLAGGVLEVIGGNGSDTVDASAVNNGKRINLWGGGGADVMIGSSGDDNFQIPDSAFAFIDGGGGLDRITLATAGQTFDLSANWAKISNVEVISLTSSSGASLSLPPADIPVVNAPGNSLYVLGGADDQVTVTDPTGTWVLVSTGVTNGALPGFTFNQYHNLGTNSDLFVSDTTTFSINL